MNSPSYHVYLHEENVNYTHWDHFSFALLMFSKLDFNPNVIYHFEYSTPSIRTVNEMTVECQIRLL